MVFQLIIVHDIINNDDRRIIILLK